MTQTIELDGRPIAVMGGTREQVEEFAESDGFRADLLSFLDSDGRPLWDGRGAFSPSVRDGTSDEEAAFQGNFADAVKTGDADLDDPADWLMFLVNVREVDDSTP